MSSAIDPSFQGMKVETGSLPGVNGGGHKSSSSGKNNESNNEDDIDDDEEEEEEDEDDNNNNSGSSANNLYPEVTAAAIAAAAHASENADSLDAETRKRQALEPDKRQNTGVDHKGSLVGSLSSRLSPLLGLDQQTDRLVKSLESHEDKGIDDNLDDDGRGSIDASPATDDRGVPLLHHGRPLTNTKRAAQNRAAQKAFRERRKSRMKELEERAKEHESCELVISRLKRENAQLKDYILALQTKLIDAGIPSLSASVNLPNDNNQNTAEGSSSLGL